MRDEQPGRSTAFCPSASSDWEDAEVLGVVEGSADGPSLSYMLGAIPVARARGLVPAPLVPEEVFRFTAPCRGGACPQFVGGRCGVARAAVGHLPEAATGPLPQCGLRPDCRWWLDEGPAACRRCPGVVTADKARVGSSYASALPFSPSVASTVASTS